MPYTRWRGRMCGTYARHRLAHATLQFEPAAIFALGIGISDFAFWACLVPCLTRGGSASLVWRGMCVTRMHESCEVRLAVQKSAAVPLVPAESSFTGPARLTGLAREGSLWCLATEVGLPSQPQPYAHMHMAMHILQSHFSRCVPKGGPNSMY